MMKLRIFLISTGIIFVFLAFVYVQFIFAVTTDLSLTVDAGTLSVSIVDGSGNAVVSPSVSFGNQSFSFDAQNFSGTLGTSTEKIRLSNPTATAAWNVSFAATGGSSAVWSDSTYTFPYNAASADDGRLTVTPPVSGGISGVDGCALTGISPGSSAFFLGVTTTSIDLMTASGSAEIGCRWDLINVALVQRIPASQPPSAYTLEMTISAT